jgi:hypothetical protein
MRQTGVAENPVQLAMVMWRKRKEEGRCPFGNALTAGVSHLAERRGSSTPCASKQYKIQSLHLQSYPLIHDTFMNLYNTIQYNTIQYNTTQSLVQIF